VTVDECKFHVNTNPKISNGINNNLKDGMEGQQRPEIPLRRNSLKNSMLVINQYRKVSTELNKLRRFLPLKTNLSHA